VGIESSERLLPAADVNCRNCVPCLPSPRRTTLSNAKLLDKDGAIMTTHHIYFRIRHVFGLVLATATVCLPVTNAGAQSSNAENVQDRAI
jgi:hypothetical protein